MIDKNVIHYLEMAKFSDFKPKKTTTLKLEIKECKVKQYKLNKFLYDIVGEPFLWFDKVKWSNDMWTEYVNRSCLHTWVGYESGAIAGYFELEEIDNNIVEINYLGLTQEFIGKGIGAVFLSKAIKEAWSLKPEKVILNTCSKDHPYALQNYLDRGFKKIKEVES